MTLRKVSLLKMHGVVSGKSRTEEIRIEAYSPWPKLFEANKHFIAKALPGVALNIEHIGSTAV